MNTIKMEFGEPEAQRQILRKPLKKKKSKSRTTSENDVTTIEDCLKAIYLQGEDVYSKRHVSILLDVLIRHGTTPNYELARVEGELHDPTYIYRVWFNDKDAIGDGKSKKEAKQSAAKAIIHKLIGVDCGTDTSTTLSSDTNDSFSSLDYNRFGNEICWLQELCTAHSWAPPKYEIEMGRPFDTRFSISCAVSNHYEVGHGRSKKIAKRSAAQKVWLIIQKEVYAGSKVKKGLEDEVPSPVNINDTNYIPQLLEISGAYQIDVKYKHVAKKTISGLFQCILQLSTRPEFNCFGTGTSKTGALTNAAHNAVLYLKSDFFHRSLSYH